MLLKNYLLKLKLKPLEWDKYVLLKQNINVFLLDMIFLLCKRLMRKTISIKNKKAVTVLAIDLALILSPL